MQNYLDKQSTKQFTIKTIVIEFFFLFNIEFRQKKKESGEIYL